MKNRTDVILKTIFREKISYGIGLLLWVGLLFFTVETLYAQSEQSQYESAYNLYLQAAALPVDSTQKQQAWNNVINAFTDFINRYPKSSKRNEAELFLGYSYLMRSGYVDANDGATGREHLNYVIQQGKTKANEDIYRKASLQYAYSFFSLMDYRSAMPALEKFISEFPDSEDLQYAYYYAGVSAANLGDYPKGQNYFQTCLTRFPNGARKDVCLIEAAAADGRAGNYDRADQEFYRLSMDSSYVYAKRATLQRAYLKVLQEDYSGAITLMEEFIRANENDSANRNLIVEALGYEAFCYLRLGRYNDGLAAINRIEQMMSNLVPKIAFLKIQLLSKSGRFDEATALLNQIQNSVMSLANSDVIRYYQSTISLDQGNYDGTINNLLSFVNITQNRTNPSQYDIHYFDSAMTADSGLKLSPQDYLNACGNLVLSYVSRNAKAGGSNYQDNANQEAVFQAMLRYAQPQTDPVLMKVVERVDRDRKVAATQPLGSGTYAGGNGQNGSQTVGLGSNVGPNQVISPSSNLNPSWPGNQLRPNGAGQPVAQGGNLPNGNGQGIGSGANPNFGDGLNGQNGTSTAQTGTRIDEEQAKEMFKKGMDFYQGNHLEEANDELLNLLTSSETLWTDCPTVAPAAALLRANILFEMKEYGEGQNVCDLLIKMAPRSPEAVDACYYCGYRADYYGKTAKAIEYLQTAVNSAHEGNYLPECYYLLAWNEWERKNTDLAEKYFAKIFRSYQNNRFWSHAAWADAEIKYQNREYVAAEKIVNEALATGPDEAIVDRLLLLKGEIALKSHDYVKARIAYETILREYPESECRQTAQNRLENIEELGGDA